MAWWKFWLKDNKKNMLAIGDVLISRDLNDKQFLCNLAKCKGACCVEGDYGAPLEQEEMEILDEIYPTIKPYLSEKSQQAILEQGTYIKDITGGYSTPLVKGRECAFVMFEDGIAKCAIEKAYFNGEVSFRKPISCHLYPIRITSHSGLEFLNYDKWDICRPACVEGRRADLKVYKFLREPIIRK